MIRNEPKLATSAPAVCQRPIQLCPVGTCQPCDTLRETSAMESLCPLRAVVGIIEEDGVLWEKLECGHTIAPAGETPNMRRCRHCRTEYLRNDRGMRDPEMAVRHHEEEEHAYTRYLRGLGRGMSALLLAACLLGSAVSAGAAETATPAAPKKPRAKPAISISVKVYPGKGLAAGEVKISTADSDSCVAWVGADEDALLVKALQACRAEIAKAGKGGAK